MKNNTKNIFMAIVAIIMIIVFLLWFVELDI